MLIRMSVNACFCSMAGGQVRGLPSYFLNEDIPEH